MSRAGLITLIYLILGLLWIYQSDAIAFSIWRDDVETLKKVGNIKGYFFVFASAALIFFLIYGVFRRLINRDDELNILLYNKGLCLLKIGLDFRIISGSRNVEELFGHSLKELQGSVLWELFEEENFDLDEEQPNTLFSFEVALKEVKHNQRWLKLTGTLDTNKKYYLVSVANISEEYLSKQMLRQELEEKNALINNSNSLIWSINKEMKLNSFNQVYAASTEPLLGRKLRKGDSVIIQEFGEEICNYWRGLYQRALAGEQFSKLESNDQAGKMTYAEISFNPIHDEEGGVIGVACFGRDITEETEARLALEESEKKFRAFTERVSDAFVAIDNDWKYTYVNTKAAELLGKSKEELLGKNMWEIFPDGIGQPFYQALHKAKKTQQTVNKELYYPPWDKWYLDHIYPTDDGISVYYHDITEKKRAELLVKQNEQHLSVIFNNTIDGMVLFKVKEDMELVLQKINPQAHNLIHVMGVDDSNDIDEIDITLVNEVIFRKKGENKKLYIRDIFQQVLRSRQIISHEVEIGDKDLFLEMDIIPTINEKGICEYLLWTIRNITVKKQLEIDLRRQQEFVRIMANNVTDAIIAYNNDGRVIYANKTALKWFGNKKEAAYIQDYARNLMLNNLSLDRLSDDELINFFADKKIKNRELILQSSVGEIQYITVNGDNFINDFDQTLGVVVVMRDITDQLSREQILTNSIIQAIEKEREAIARELHDSLTQNLSIVSMNLKNLVYEVEGLQSLSKYQKAMEFLDISIEESRGIAHRMMPKAIVDFGLVPSLKELFENFEITYGISVDFYWEKVPQMNKNTILNVFRIIQEGLNNIQKHAEAKKVKVNLFKKENFMEIEIDDDGKGFEASVFSSNLQGIGLRTMKNRVVAMRGLFQIKSGTEGTNIFIRIPIVNKKVLK